MLLLKSSTTPFGFARDGRRFASAGTDHVAWAELAVEPAVRQLYGHRTQVEQLSWSRDDRLLASIDSVFEVRVWDRAAGTLVDHFHAPVGDFFVGNAGFALGTDGRLLAYASGGEQESRAVIRDVREGRFAGEWILRPGGFERMVATGPGRFLLVREELDQTGDNVATVVWYLQVGREPERVRTIRPADPGDRRRFLDHGLTADGELYLWNGPRIPPGRHRVEVRRVATGELLLSLPRPAASAGEMVVLLAPSGRYLWHSTGGNDHYLTDLQTRVTTRADCFPGAVTARNEWTALTKKHWLRGHSALQLRSGESMRLWLEFTNGDLSDSCGTSFSHDGRHLAWGSKSGTITVADLPALQKAIAAFEVGYAE